MLPSNLTQWLRIGIMGVQGTEFIGELWGVGLADGNVNANAPAKFRPVTAIAVKRIAAITVVFILIISSF
jgi:hypothetical protein